MFQGDIIIKNAIDMMLEDIRNQPWLIDDVFSDLVENPILKDKHGQKEIESIKDWFENNNIQTFLKHRLDGIEYPCVTIELGSSLDLEDHRTLGDQDIEVIEYGPEDIDKPINYIINPFDIISYDDSTKIVTLPSSVDVLQVGKGMLLVDPDTGNAYTIESIVSEDQLKIPDDQSLGAVTRFGIAPQYMFYRARRERRYFKNEYTLAVKAHGHPAHCIWLWSIVLYGLMRYNEALLEKNCFQLATFKSTDLRKDDTGGDNIYTRYITVSGMVKNSWVKQPSRSIEKVNLICPTDEVPAGIKILSNSSDQIATTDSPWQVVDEDSE